ncbi:hypothetical protein V6R21_19360 [Limibacter armeniacum]|uniref:hypothetical protein n=1 Tax=Limibacter armeniacum TaxID=466084 RepID=UPI002FE654EA
MNFLPKDDITLVLPFSAAEAKSRLEEATLPPGYKPEHGFENFFQFNGIIKKDTFTFSRRIRTAQNFLPVVTGEIECSNPGSLVFVHFRMFESTKLYLYLGTLICLTLLVLFVFVKPNIVYASICLMMLVLNYLTTLLSFHRQVKITQQVIEEILFSTRHRERLKE